MTEDEQWTEYPRTQMTYKDTRMPARELARRGALWIAILTLAVAVILTIVTVNQVIGVWLLPQYVPLARLAVSLVVGGGALWAIWALTRARPA